MKVPLAEWKVTRQQKRLIKEVLNSGRLTYGDKTRELEQRMAEIHGAKHALFTSSGTDALKIALGAMKEKHGWADGDEVLIPAVTFVATMNIVTMNNLVPVLVDIDPDTVNIDPAKMKRAMTEKTRAIIPVHLFGQTADMDRIMASAEKNGLIVIEDSCETMFVNQLQGDVACFSTYLTHLLTTGIGGFIMTNDDEMATTMRSMMFHGRDESYLTIDDQPDDISKRFWFPRFGYSDRATELEAALGLGVLDDWEVMIERRQANAYYLLQHLPVDDFPFSDIIIHAFMFFPIIVERRDELMNYLQLRGIETRTMMPLTTQPITQPFLKKKYPKAEYINEHGLLLPCHQYLTREQLEYMVSVIKGFYANT